MMKKNRMGVRGCIKNTRGPWMVHRSTKDGRVVSKLRFPSERERENNKERERRRRNVARRIFACLRAHGNYNLPSHPNSNHLLIALCQEAGWTVHQDGTIFRNKEEDTRHEEPTSSIPLHESKKAVSGDYCSCHEHQQFSIPFTHPNNLQVLPSPDHQINLSLSL